MIKTVSALFQTYDEAENCARILKHHISDIVSLRLKSHDATHDTKEFAFIAPVGSANNSVTGNDINIYNPRGIYGDIYSRISESEISQRQDTALTLEIDDSQLKAAEKILRSNGGMMIKKLTIE